MMKLLLGQGYIQGFYIQPWRCNTTKMEIVCMAPGNTIRNYKWTIIFSGAIKGEVLEHQKKHQFHFKPLNPRRGLLSVQEACTKSCSHHWSSSRNPTSFRSLVAPVCDSDRNHLRLPSCSRRVRSAGGCCLISSPCARHVVQPETATPMKCLHKSSISSLLWDCLGLRSSQLWRGWKRKAPEPLPVGNRRSGPIQVLGQWKDKCSTTPASCIL